MHRFDYIYYNHTRCCLHLSVLGGALGIGNSGNSGIGDVDVDMEVDTYTHTHTGDHTTHTDHLLAGIGDIMHTSNDRYCTKLSFYGQCNHGGNRSTACV